MLGEDRSAIQIINVGDRWNPEINNMQNYVWEIQSSLVIYDDEWKINHVRTDATTGELISSFEENQFMTIDGNSFGQQRKKNEFQDGGDVSSHVSYRTINLPVIH